MSNIDTYTARNAAAELAERIELKSIDPSMIDELKRPPEDRPPAYADAIFSQAPTSIERAAEIQTADWQLITKALKHFAACEHEVAG